MKFFAGLKYHFIPDRVPRLFLCLRAEDGIANYEAMQGSGAFIHIMNEKLVGVDSETAREKAFADFGSLQPIQTIELDEDDLNHLARYRVN